MKKQIVVTIAGPAMAGKSAIAAMVAFSLDAGSFTVVNEDAADLSHGDTASRLAAIADETQVTIRTRLTAKSGSDLSVRNEDCLAKLKEARDFVNSIGPLGKNVDQAAQSKALALIDTVADEIEDRLSAAQALGGAGA